ncbi:hypothetical protein FRC09_003117, partial [Ceratobasidium sp. 395]
PRIIAYFQDLPATRIIGLAMALKWEGFFGAAMGLWPAFFALYVSAERRTSVQAMQLSNGMTPAGLWLGHLLFDLPWITLISTVICAVFGIVTKQFYALGAFWVVLELYGVAGALFAYVVSTFVDSPLASFAVTGGYNGMMSILYGTAYIVTLTYTQPSESKQLLEVVHYTISLLSPVASVVRAAFVSINVFSLLCDGFGHYNSSPPSSIDKFGGPIIYLVGWIGFLSSLLMWIEHGKPLPKWFRFHRAGSTTETDDEKVVAENGSFSAEVKAEAERVRQSDDSLRLLDVGKTFSGSFTAVENASFGVDNEVFAMLGPNGAGKTTTFNIIRGNVRPTRGDVLINGTSIVDEPATTRLSLGVTPQFSAVDSQLTVREHMAVYGSLKGLRGGDLDRNVDLLMDATALTQYAGRVASKLSGGNARKLSLALALIGNPRVLLIDEYSTGIDPATKRAMWKTLRRVSTGKAVLITTHSMEEASALASRVGILSKKMLVTMVVNLNPSLSLTPELGDMLHASDAALSLRPLLEVPTHFTKLLPPPNCSVVELVNATIPESDQDDTIQFTEMFSDLPPRLPDYEDLCQHSMPTKSVRDKISTSLEQRYTTGAQSIVYSPITKVESRHPFGKPEYRYPFWILSWWNLAEKSYKTKQKWKKSYEWLTHAYELETDTAARAILSQGFAYLKCLPSDVLMPGGDQSGESTVDFSTYLSNEWLRSRHIEWMMEVLDERSKIIPTGSCPIFVRSPSFFVSLDKFECRKDDAAKAQAKRHWRKFQRCISEGQTPTIYSVANYNNIHWIAFVIDFRSRTIRYGDSMGVKHMAMRTCNIIQSWLSLTWSYDKFKVEKLPCADQKADNNSCGVCAINALELALFGDRVWTFELAAAYRVSKFIEVAHRYVKHQGITSLPNRITIQEEIARQDSHAHGKVTTNRIVTPGTAVSSAEHTVQASQRDNTQSDCMSTVDDGEKKKAAEGRKWWNIGSDRRKEQKQVTHSDSVSKRINNRFQKLTLRKETTPADSKASLIACSSRLSSQISEPKKMRSISDFFPLRSKRSIPSTHRHKAPSVDSLESGNTANHSTQSLDAPYPNDQPAPPMPELNVDPPSSPISSAMAGSEPMDWVSGSENENPNRPDLPGTPLDTESDEVDELAGDEGSEIDSWYWKSKFDNMGEGLDELDELDELSELDEEVDEFIAKTT